MTYEDHYISLHDAFVKHSHERELILENHEKEEQYYKIISKKKYSKWFGEIVYNFETYPLDKSDNQRESYMRPRMCYVLRISNISIHAIINNYISLKYYYQCSSGLTERIELQIIFDDMKFFRDFHYHQFVDINIGKEFFDIRIITKNSSGILIFDGFRIHFSLSSYSFVPDEKTKSYLGGPANPFQGGGWSPR